MSSALNATCIEDIRARELFDSRGLPTVEVEVHCRGGRSGSAIAPSGASTGSAEALELRDRQDSRLRGQGVRRAVAQVHEQIAGALRGRDATAQKELDRLLIELDGTPNKSRLGGNATTAVSLAIARAAAAARDISFVEHLHELWSEQISGRTLAGSRTQQLGRSLLLPLPMVNMISGGLHAGGNLDIQDVLILPVGAKSYREALTWIVTVYHSLGKQLRQSGFEGSLVGDEGGYGPRLGDNRRALDLVVQAISAAGFEPGRQIALGLDVAATHFETPEGYRLEHCAPARTWSYSELADLFSEWVDRYPIVSIEDPVAEGDHAGWRLMTERLGSRVQLIGDDLFVTNAELLREGIAAGLANSVLIKINQIGTLTETLDTMALALESGYWPVVSARSGETEDSSIADLAVATGAGQIKIGSVARSERLAKYNQLLRLEERLGSRAGYIGGQIFSSLGRS